MPNLLETVNSIEAPRPFSESDITRFDERHPAYINAPEQQPEQPMFTHNPELELAANVQEVAINVQKAAELATPASDTFIVPQTPDQIAAEQQANVEVITSKSTNVESLEDRRYRNAKEALDEAMNAGLAIENVRNAA